MSGESGASGRTAGTVIVDVGNSMRRWHRLCTHPISPWDFAARCIAQGVDDETLHEAVAALYLQRDPWNGELVKCCAFTGRRDRTEVAHIIARDDGWIAFEILTRTGAVPAWADSQAMANLLPLAPVLHGELGHHSLSLLPSLDVILARLAGEAVYAAQRKSSPPGQPLPFHPTFTDFYAELEKRTPVVEVVFTHSMLTAAAAVAHPPRPLFMLPISLNCLIFGMIRRLRLHEPLDVGLQRRSKIISDAASILFNIWWLKDGDAAKLDDLLEQAKELVESKCPASPYAGPIINPATYSLADVLTIPSPAPPSNTISALGVPPEDIDEAGSDSSSSTSKSPVNHSSTASAFS